VTSASFSVGNVAIAFVLGLTGAISACAGDHAAAEALPVEASTGRALPLYHMGADITWVQRDEFYGATYVDSDGRQKDILALLKSHGFNSVRLRIFVDPQAADGYDQIDGFADLSHTVTMAQRIKQAGMTLLLAFHYSDNWADPSKQCIPVAWQQDTFEMLVQHVHDYTLSAVSTLKTAGATPDMVQIGNEITFGMLFNVCDAMGFPLMQRPEVNGSDGDWANFGTLLKAGVKAVQEVDTNIKIVMHIDRGGDITMCTNWIRNAQVQAVPFDIFAGTTYVGWQGQPSAWQDNFNMLAAAFPTLSFIIPEYSDETATSPPIASTLRIANDIIFDLPNSRGVGTWFFEPERPFIGTGLFQANPGGADLTDANVLPRPTYVAIPAAMAKYDLMRAAYAGRL